MQTYFHIPMVHWQALSFMRETDACFRRLLASTVEIVPYGVLGCFPDPGTASDWGHKQFPDGFAVLRIAIDAITHAELSSESWLLVDNRADGRRWYLTPSGIDTVRKRLQTGEAEMVISALVGAAPAQSDIQMCGPTGFGC